MPGKEEAGAAVSVLAPLCEVKAVPGYLRSPSLCTAASPAPRGFGKGNVLKLASLIFKPLGFTKLSFHLSHIKRIFI